MSSDRAIGQMYRVKFARQLSDDHVDLGDVIVCATSAEQAGASVASILGVAMSKTEMEISRVKPSIYQISRQTIKNTASAHEAHTVKADELSRATFPGVTESMPDEFLWVVTAQAQIRAENEDWAITKLGKAIERQQTGEKQKTSCKEFEIKAERLDLSPRSPAVDKNSLYVPIRIFQGGDGRTG